MKKNNRKCSLEKVLPGDISHSSDQMPKGGNIMKKQSSSLSSNNPVTSGENHSSEQTSKGQTSMKVKIPSSLENILSSIPGSSFRRLRGMEDVLSFLRGERKTVTLKLDTERELAKLELAKIRINAMNTVSDWGSYKPTVRVTSIGKQVIVEIEGYLPENSQEYLPFWESMISDAVDDAVRNGAKNEIAYETFSKSFVNPETFMNSLKQIIAGIYNIDTDSIAASYSLVVDDGMTVYRFDFWENTVKNHEKNLAKLRAADEAMMIRLEREALAA